MTHREHIEGHSCTALGFLLAVTYREHIEGHSCYSVGFSAHRDLPRLAVTHREHIGGHSCTALGFLLAETHREHIGGHSFTALGSLHALVASSNGQTPLRGAGDQ